MHCPFHPGNDGGEACDCVSRLSGEDGLGMVHADRVSFYPCSRLVRLESRLYVFPYPTRKSLLIAAALAGHLGVTVFHRCPNAVRRNLYVVFQFVDSNGFRYGLGYALDVIRGSRTVLTHLRCAQRAIRAFLVRRRERRELAAVMGVLSVAPLPSDLLRLCLGSS